MPPLLSRAYTLTVIGASLHLAEDDDPSDPVGVHVEVDLPGSVRLQRDLALEDLGLPLDLKGIDRALAEGAPLALPEAWRGELLRALAPAPREEPVWLDFRRPFGHLPAMPWERLLVPLLGVPLVRLPFSAVPPPDVPDDLRVAVCAPWSGTTALRDFLATVVPVVPGARIDVFTADPAARDAVAPGTAVRFHEPPTDRRAATTGDASGDASGSSRPDNPWLRWMLDGIGPGTVDVVHLICPAGVSENYGMLDFGASPAGVESPRSVRLVGVGQLLDVLTEFGAWSLSVAMPEVRTSGRGEAGLRIFAHRMTGLLSGPVTLQAPAGPAHELAAAYRFLYTRAPEPVPLTPSLMIACHPDLVRSRTIPAAPVRVQDDEAAERIERTLHDCTLGPDVLLKARRSTTEPSAWVASSQRILERWTSNVLGTEVDPAVSSTVSRGVTDALSFISRSIESSVRGQGDDR